MRIKNQLLLTHGLLVFLSILIVVTNVFAFKTLEKDAVITNHTGKLRAISYNMAQIANQIDMLENNPTTLYVEEDKVHLSERLEQRMEEFDAVLAMLTGQTEDLSMVVTHGPTKRKLEKVCLSWEEIFRPAYLNMVESNLTHVNCVLINEEIDAYVAHIDEMVTSYSIYSKSKVANALIMNAGLVFLILLLTVYSFKTTRHRIEKPMRLLMDNLRELSMTETDVSERLKNIKVNEISRMTEYFHVMMYDQLTETYNRRSGMGKLNQILKNRQKRKEQLSVCFFDINDLKVVNDELGHKYGDELIISVVECVNEEIREEDFVIRMGGDEFLIVFIGICAPEAEAIWTKIAQRFTDINEQEDRPYAISVSHGIVSCNHKKDLDIDLLIKAADEKMYEEKRYMKEELRVKIIRDRPRN